ncbi:hypothetical protein GVN24_24745 [Rhizobium sp. CRIBSB]|nr:hypothetical protein [Rhizobium sp. CRIBSB]
MAGPRKKAQAPGPEKFDPEAPAPMPADAVLRGRASRPTFRRGGLVFGDRDWTPIDPATIGDEAVLAILREPVITLQLRGPGDTWETMTDVFRADAVVATEMAIAARPATEQAAPPAA